MKKHCEHCLEEFEAKRSDTRFCSGKCKKKSLRGVSATANMSPEQIREYKKKEMELKPIANDELISATVEATVNENRIESFTISGEADKVAKKVWEQIKDKDADIKIFTEPVDTLDVPEEDVLGRIKKGLPVNVRLTELRQYYTYDNMYHFVHVCYIPTKEEYEEAIITYQTYEDQFPITNKEHAKALEITSTQCMCSFCGERYGSMQGRCSTYCKYCKTKEQRNNVEKANHARNIMAYYKAHHKEFDLYEPCPICNVKI